ncbi:MAG: sigma 54-interacting transcriptional regulator [Candidatus Binataceae bacterium]
MTETRSAKARGGARSLTTELPAESGDGSSAGVKSAHAKSVIAKPVVKSVVSKPAAKSVAKSPPIAGIGASAGGLEHGLTALVEGNVGKFASEVIGLGELLVERRVPLIEAVASLGLLCESAHAVSPGNSSLPAAIYTAFGKLSYVQVMLLTTAYFSSQAALAGERIAALERRAARLAANRRTRFNGLVGASPPMRELYQRIEAAGQTVLILGESGAGKGLVARAIHESGPREHRQFVALNCAAFPKDLIESELFGYTRDALYGAGGECLGIFRAADGGTVFVDEITEVEAETQRKLLRAIVGRTVLPVGSSREQPVDVRVIASVNSNPLEAIARGGLHQELYDRLQASVIEIPPLRERRDDIPLLVEHFIARCNQSFDGAVLGVSPEALQAMMEHSWPGNVRELSDVIESACTFGDAQLISLEHLPPTIGMRKVHADGVPGGYLKA